MPDTQRQLIPGKMAAWVIIPSVIIILGFAYYLRVKAQKQPDFASRDSSASVAIVSSAVSRDVQMSAENTLRAFLEDLHRQDYVQALTKTSLDFPVPHTPSTLQVFSKRQEFSSIFDGPLDFDAASTIAHGQGLVLRASVQSKGKSYRTVCKLTKNKGRWLISGILDPVPPSAPPIERIIGGTAKAH